MTKKIEIGQKAEVKVTWNVSSVDYSKEKEENVKVSFANKYGISPSKVTVDTNIISVNGNGVVSLNKDTIQSIQDPKFQLELFKQYLKEHDITDCDFDEIVKIDSQINALIDYDSYEKGKKYELKWLDWDNFLSYGPNNHVDFTDFNGLVLLNSVPANQGGKSTFAYDLLHFLFYGKTRSGKMETLADLFNDNIPEATTVKVEGCLTIDGCDYIIRRTLTRPSLTSKSKTRAVTQKVEYFRLLGDDKLEELADVDNLNGENNVKTSKAIKEAIGNERDFDMVISANADNLKELIALKDTDRGRLLTRWIGLMPLEDKDIIAREKWNKEINVNRFSTRYNRETLSSEIEYLGKQNEDNEKQIKKETKNVKACDKKITDYTLERDTLLSSKKTIDSGLFNVDVVTLDTAIERITNEGVKVKKLYEAEVAKLNAYSDLPVLDETVVKNLYTQKESMVGQIATIKATINNLKNANITLEKSEYCPTCGRKFDNVDNTDKIEDNKRQIATLIEQGVSIDNARKELEEKISSFDTLRAQHTEKNRIELLISRYNVELGNLREELVNKRQLKKSIEDNKAAIEENNKIDTALNIVTQNIKTEEGIKNNSQLAIMSFNKDIETNKQNIIDRQVIIQKIEEEAKAEKYWKLYLTLVGKEGVSKMVLRNALPLINSELKRLLEGVCDFDVEVQMNDKNDVDFKMITKKTGVIRRLAAGSGLEQTAASLALRVVLGNMSALSKPPFLLLDEVLGGVADENYENLRLLYNKISNNYKFIFQITHLKSIVDWHNKTLTIIKNDKGISHVDVA